MIRASTLKRALYALLVAMTLAAVAGAGQAAAAPCVDSPEQECMPWWRLNTISSPASVSGGEGQVMLEARDMGDAMVNSLEYPVTITDKLPVGVTPVETRLAGDLFQLSEFTVPSFASCSISGQTVTCTYGGFPLLAYERIGIGIDVQVAAGKGTGTNEVSISGGGAPSMISRRPLALNDSAPPYGVQSYELTPEEVGGAVGTQAGSHPFQLTTDLIVNTRMVPEPHATSPEPRILNEPIAMTRDLTFTLPPGLVGNPTPLPKCPVRVFLAKVNACPDNTVVGVAVPILTFALPGTPIDSLYSLEPSVGEPARFGFSSPGGPVILDTAVRTGGDYAVIVKVSKIPQAAEFIGSQVTFWGVPGDVRHDSTRGACLAKTEFFARWELSCADQEKPQPLLIMPTLCDGPWHSSVETDSWDAPGHWAPREYTSHNSAGEPVGEDGCNRLNFEPSVNVAPDGQEAATPTGLTVGVHVPQEASLNPSGLAESAVKDTTVTLPAGVGLNPAGADGLTSCGMSEVGLESPTEQSCPEASKVGTVEIETPLLPHRLEGAAYLAQQNANPFGSLVALYLVAKDPYSGVIIKLAGQVTPDPVTGQLVSTFKNTPPLPFENLRLHFFGGSRAPLGTPALCGSYSTTASISPWSGNPPVGSSSTFEITSGPNHTSCSDPLPFTPELTTGSLNIQAGAFTPFTLTMSREDGNQNLDAIQLKMPSGLLGELSKVKLCDEAQANAGSCGPESLIGETVVSVGLGGNPYTVKGGKVYITGPYAGAPYGLSIVNPAKAGPFDLGQVVVRAKIEVDPTTSAITITSDRSGPYRIPQFIDGIPLEIKHVNVTITRPEFTFNPTNCEPQQIGGSLTSGEGAVSTLHVPFQVTNCATLGFKPIFKVSTTGRTSRANGASLDVRLTYPKAPFGTQANIGYVKVSLPKQLPSRLDTLKKACPDTVFNQNPAACPAESRIGSATATTPVLPVFLEGPAYFVSHGGAKFPELIIALQGQGVTVYLHGETFINKQGITSSTFKTIPDVPVGEFHLHLPQGPYSALAANTNLCTASLKMPTIFHAQNGMQVHQPTPITVTGCPKHKAKKTNHKHHKHKQTKHKKKK
jgi:hypothetical protein